MKNVKKRVISIALTVAVMCSLSSQIFASNVIFDGEEYVYYDDYMTFQAEDTTLESIDVGTIGGEQAQLNYMPGDLVYSETGSTGAYSRCAYYRTKGLVLQQFVRYLTESWAPASQYVWSKSNTASMSLSGSSSLSFAQKVVSQVGLSISRTTTYSVAITIPADSSKLSRLGFASDFDKFTYDYKTYNAAGVCIESSMDVVNCPTSTSYLLVYYK